MFTSVGTLLMRVHVIVIIKQQHATRVIRFSSFSTENKHFTNVRLISQFSQFVIYLKTLGNQGLISPIINNILIPTKAMPLA